jgi:nucleotide-binding universal stress UspA family protein
LLGEEMTGSTDRGGGQIVVGVDGTAASAVAVCWAILEARLRQARVHLVFAYDHDRRSRAPYAGRSAALRPDEDNAAGTVLSAAEQ